MTIGKRFWLLSFGICLCLILQAQHKQLKPIYDKANSFRQAGDFDSAIVYFLKSHDLARALHDTLYEGNSLIGTGISYDKSGNYQKALEYYFRALKIYETLDNKAKIGGTYKNIGNVYRVLADFRNAEKYLFKALNIQEAVGDSTRIATVVNDIGNYYLDLEDYRKAYSMYYKVITAFKASAQPDVLAFAHNNIGIVLSELKSYKESALHYDTSLSLMIASNDRYGTALVFGNMADLQYKLGNYHLALQYQEENIKIGKEINSDDILVVGYSNMARTYRQLGNFAKAFHFQEEKMTIKDTIYKKEAAKSYAEMEAKYQNEVNQKENALLQQRNELINIKLSIEERTKYFLFAISSLILILAAVAYGAYRNKKRTSDTLQHLNAKLNEADQSKAKLISIISHDLRSPISSLFHYLQLQKTRSTLVPQEEVNQKVISSADHLLEVMEDLLIWSKSQMEKFEPSWEVISARELLDEVTELNTRYAEIKNITLVKKIERDFQFQTDLNFMKIILRNLVGNAIKYTPHHGTVILIASESDQEIKFSVEDNGAGVSKEEINRILEWNGIKSDASGLGLRLVNEFTEKLNGKLTVLNLTPHGSAFQVSFPGSTSAIKRAQKNLTTI